MPAPFPRWTTPVFRWALVLGAVALIASLVGLVALEDRWRVSRQMAPPEQPMWFDHRHHVAGYGIDCLYCHYAATRSSTAAVPATRTCVPCHTETWLQSPYFEPVRASLSTDRPIAWRRVHDLPDFVFFDHSIHVNKGVGCETCHGRVDRMERVRQVASLSMAWCLECHRSPQRHLRPREEVTTMGWEPERPREELGPEIMDRYDVRSGRSITTCTACHR